MFGSFVFSCTLMGVFVVVGSLRVVMVFLSSLKNGCPVVAECATVSCPGRIG